MAKNGSIITQSPQEAQKRADEVRDSLVFCDLYPRPDFPDDGDPAAWLAEVAPRLSRADLVGLYLAADRLARSPEHGYWQRRQARIDALLSEPLGMPTEQELQSVGGFLASLAGEVG